MGGNFKINWSCAYSSLKTEIKCSNGGIKGTYFFFIKGATSLLSAPGVLGKENVFDTEIYK